MAIPIDAWDLLRKYVKENKTGPDGEIRLVNLISPLNAARINEQTSP